MKFAIGYQEPQNGEEFSAICADYRDAVAEVYFPWTGMASGRSMLGRRNGMPDLSAQKTLERNLAAIRGMGIKLDLLLNANCYGDRAISKDLAMEVFGILEYLEEGGLLPEIITTTSPFLAEQIRKSFPEIELRASVNMRLDSTFAMELLADRFDSFHIRRDLQRDLGTVEIFHRWCEAHGKKLCMLANSGCLRNCPAQTFHDNLVAHDAGVDLVQNVPGQHHLCRRHFSGHAHFEDFLKGSWVRPEDLLRYERFFPVVKLATRLHDHPRMVIGAYASGHFDGNLADLLEPGFSGEFYPYVVDNTRFPADWWQTAGACAVNCTHCGKCEAVAKQVFLRPACTEGPEL